MLRNYLKLALRSLFKNKFVSFINIFGLTIGLTCCFLISAYIINELSYDKYNRHEKNIYRLERSFVNPDTKMTSLQLGTVAPPFAPLLQNDFKEIKKITRLLQNYTIALKYGENKFNENNVYFADENLFDIFDVNVVKGNASKALNDPLSVMMTEELAKKYFGNDEPLNKLVKLDNQLYCKVTGIYKSFPANAHIHPSALISFNTLKDSAVYGQKQLETNWGNNSFFTYMLLPDNYDPKKLEAQFPAFQDRYIRDQGGTIKIQPSAYSKLTLRKLTDIHLYAHSDLEAEENGDIKRVYIFSAIALFILLIACINYMNLSTARSVIRAKEIGIRKVVGAMRTELVSQFLTESILLSWIALLLATIMTIALLPWLNQLSGQQLSVSLFMKWQIIVPLLLTPFILGTISGLYPAVFLSSFQPIRVLKGIFRPGYSGLSLRKVLVIAQFVISIVLIIATAIVIKQLHYMQNKSLGFNKDRIINLQYVSSLDPVYKSFRTELLNTPYIKEVGRSSRIPTGRLLDAQGSQMILGDKFATVKADIKYVRADEYFLPTYGVKMIAGRNFSKDYGMDTSAFLVNEAAVKALGLQSNELAIGKPFMYGAKKGTLTGVFSDFHFESLHQRILPLVLFIPSNSNTYNNVSIKIAGNNIPAALAKMEDTWKKLLPETPYEYSFLDDKFAKLYDSEARHQIIFTIFACIAIFIACLGLFGLTAFAIAQRVKEIGIRKVLGATITDIVTILSTDILKLVLVAAVIAIPIAWYTMNKWLEDFAYRVSIPYWLFLGASVVAALVAFATISIQAIKAAIANPVKSLKNE